MSSITWRFALKIRADLVFCTVNVDVAVSGSSFEASASPLLQTALLHVLERVVDPMKNKTLRAVWAEKGSKLGGLGAGSEYVAPKRKSRFMSQA